MAVARTTNSNVAQSRTPNVIAPSSPALPGQASRATPAARQAGLVGGENPRAVERTHLRGHQPLRSRAEARQHAVARLRIDEAVAAQGFHMDEDVLGALAPGEKTETARTVEPLDDNDFEPADGGRLGAGARRTRRRSVVRFRLDNRDHLEHLKPALAPRRLGDDPCPFPDRREAVPAQNGDVDEDV